MMQQYDHITFKFERPNSLIYLSSVRHEGLLFLPSVLYFQQAKAEGQQKPYVEEDDIKRLSSSLITGQEELRHKCLDLLYCHFSSQST